MIRWSSCGWLKTALTPWSAPRRKSEKWIVWWSLDYRDWNPWIATSSMPDITWAHWSSQTTFIGADFLGEITERSWKGGRVWYEASIITSNLRKVRTSFFVLGSSVCIAASLDCSGRTIPPPTWCLDRCSSNPTSTYLAFTVNLTFLIWILSLTDRTWLLQPWIALVEPSLHPLGV